MHFWRINQKNNVNKIDLKELSSRENNYSIFYLLFFSLLNLYNIFSGLKIQTFYAIYAFVGTKYWQKLFFLKKEVLDKASNFLLEIITVLLEL